MLVVRKLACLRLIGQGALVVAFMKIGGQSSRVYDVVKSRLFVDVAFKLDGHH